MLRCMKSAPMKKAIKPEEKIDKSEIIVNSYFLAGSCCWEKGEEVHEAMKKRRYAIITNGEAARRRIVTLKHLPGN